MRQRRSDLAGLAQLHQVEDVDQIRALWRRGIATLAALAQEHQPVPLEGFSPSALLAGASIALNIGLCDQLDWLSPAAAAVAMYELASALPRSNEKRELGRRVLTTLHQGDAETFVGLATSLALGSSRVLSGAQIHARVALCLYLPVSMGMSADALALALISRRDSEREWLSIPSTGSLPSRELAARLLERAAREAARRAAAGDDAGVQVFNQPAVAAAYRRLLTDRESLVWRHVAAARGLLSEAVPGHMTAIERELSVELTPTEWRRAAASLTARIAFAPDETIARCRQVLCSDILKRDRGVVAAMIFGLPCAADAEHDTAEELLGELLAEGDIFAVEALVDLRRERIESNFGVRAAAHARALLLNLKAEDDGEDALKEALYSELSPPERRFGRSASSLYERLVAALKAFAEGGAFAARGPTDQALEAANDALIQLERSSGDSADDRRQAFLALRELDRGLLETTTLSDLVTISSASEEAMAPVDRIRARLMSWLIAHEGKPLTEGTVTHPFWRLRRLRTLLHLVDADGATSDMAGLRERRMRTMSVLLSRISQDVSSPLRRTVCATLARACDAVVREEICELSDVFVAAATSVSSDDDLAILAEASMDPQFKELLRAYVDAVRTARIAREDPAASNVDTCLEGLRTMIHAVPAAQSPRVEALRAALLRFTDSLSAVRAARSLTELVESSAILAELEGAIQWLGQLIHGAQRRLDRPAPAPQDMAAALRAVDAAVERTVRDGGRGLSSAVAKAAQILRQELLPGLADIAALVLWRIPNLPPVTPPDDDDDAPAASDRPRMVAWLPPGRTLGGFYILRTIGKGAVGSVFVARRVEERHDDGAETFALKVPEYNGAAAFTLSESEFLRLFREEARALLSLPEHPNLARFVTFDLGARPKPILVMELVEGPTLERVLDRDEFTMGDAFDILDGVAAGLGAMHGVGVAHLDVKPSNIILRSSASEEIKPVLVDFGLAGRKIRPGCATVHYGAPEVWSTKRTEVDPMPTDVYAFSCLAFELVTNEILFDGDTAVSIVSDHLGHDGWPPLLRKLKEHGEWGDLADILALGLRPLSEERVPISDIRAQLVRLAKRFGNAEWPLIL